jgi:hypothetical protein
MGILKKDIDIGSASISGKIDNNKNYTIQSNGTGVGKMTLIALLVQELAKQYDMSYKEALKAIEVHGEQMAVFRTLDGKGTATSSDCVG